MDGYQKTLEKYLVDQVSIYPPFFSPLWIKTSGFNPVIFTEKIYYYKNIIFHPEQLILALEESELSLSDDDAILPWEPWESSDGDYVFGEKKSTNDKKYFSSSQQVQFVYGQLKNALTFVGDHYASSIGVAAGKQAPISISKYFSGSEMGPHTDSFSPKANISGVLYINDDYEGGELYFPNQDVRIKPEAGSIIMFPSVEPYVHHSVKVTSGEKYISPAFWFKS
jgi:hypothetical protein